jgi:hypothetical protein
MTGRSADDRMAACPIEIPAKFTLHGSVTEKPP